MSGPCRALNDKGSVSVAQDKFLKRLESSMMERFFYLFLFLFALVFTPVTTIASSADEAVRELIRERVSCIRSENGVGVADRAIASVIVLPALYEKSDYRPLWTNSQSVSQLFVVLGSIQDDGLDPADYHGPLLTQMKAKIESGGQNSPSVLAYFDLLMSDSLIRLGYHLLVGKVNPEELDSNWNMERTVCELDAILQMAGAISDGTVVKLVQSLRPQAPAYHRLRAALAHYRTLKAQGGWDTVPGGSMLKLGMTDARVAQLRKRLEVSGDLQEANLESMLFDEDVRQAVEHFQRRHGLVADGIVGQGTLAALNVSVDAKINQLLVNLERARWILHDLPKQFVVVDIAGFSVKYLRDGNIIWETRAQVGQKYRMTPVFKSEIKFLVMNPTWTIPLTVFTEDVLPKVKKDPDYLQKKDFRVITYGREYVDERTIDWSKYPKEKFPYLLRQEPGPKNALGRIKFMFPNTHDVYLHDTPSKGLFNMEARAFSSGCVRVEHPFSFAELLLDDDKWNEEKILEIIDSKETKQVSLQTPVPILLLYWTVTAENDGTVIFKKDIYGRDAEVLAVLQSPFTFNKCSAINNSMGNDLGSPGNLSMVQQ